MSHKTVEKQFTGIRVGMTSPATKLQVNEWTKRLAMDYKTIQSHFVALTTNLSIQSFLKELLDKHLLPAYTVESLLHQPSSTDQNIEFFLNIRRYGNEVLKYFSEWLKLNNRELFDHIISQNDSKIALKTAKLTKEQFRKKRMLFIDCLNTRIVACAMYEKGHLSNHQLEKIVGFASRYSTNLEKVRELLYVLDKQSGHPSFFANFENVLAKHQPSVYDEMLKEQ